MKALSLFVLFLSQVVSVFAQSKLMETMPRFIVDPVAFAQKYKAYSAAKEGGFFYFTEVVPTSDKTLKNTEESFFRELLGGVHYVFVPQTKADYFLVLYLSPINPITYKKIADLTPIELDLSRVKSNLNHGSPHSSTRRDHAEVAEYMRTYSPEEAQQLFGTSFAASYPLNLKGKTWAERYERARCFLTLNETTAFYLYVFSTDDYIPYFMDNLKSDLTGDFNFSVSYP